MLDEMVLRALQILILWHLLERLLVRHDQRGDFVCLGVEKDVLLHFEYRTSGSVPVRHFPF